MSDITCRKCGEPWEAYGVYHRTDMDDEEAKRFLRGEGCPSCDFGNKCPMCNGSGKERCERCFGSGEVSTHERGNLCDQCPPQTGLRSWSDTIARCPRPKRKTCPSCDGARVTGQPCRHCGGSGKPTSHTDQFLCSLVDSTDEDPIALLNDVVEE